MNNAYLVICGHSDQPYAPERDLADMSWNATVRQISEMQFENLRSVIEIGTGADVTERAVTAAAAHHVDDTCSFAFYQLVELVCGTRAARGFLRTA